MRFNVSLHPGDIKAEFGVGEKDHTWVTVEDQTEGMRIDMHREAPEEVVTAIVGALPEPRRVALLKTLTAEWYAASAKAEGLTVVDDPRYMTAPEDERFEETR